MVFRIKGENNNSNNNNKVPCKDHSKQEGLSCQVGVIMWRLISGVKIRYTCAVCISNPLILNHHL